MIRRTAGNMPGVLILAALQYGWFRLGEPAHRDGQYAALGLGMVLAILAPGIIVSAEALPRLLVPSRARAWWRDGQPRPAIRAYLRRTILFAYGYRCCWCHSGEDLQIDHIRPWCIGGLNALWNLAVLCGPCNRVKSNYWRYRGGGIIYKPFRNARNEELAAAILRHEKWHRLSPWVWLRAGWALGA